MNDGLVLSARNGDQRAFAKLVEEYYRPIYGLVFSTVGNWHAAEDVAQDAFLVAWSNLEKLRNREVFGAWLRRIARNLASNWIRSEVYRRALQQRREAIDFRTAPQPNAALDQLARADAKDDTWAALATLTPPLREAVVLYYLEENSIAQTATMLGVTENSIKKRLQHARIKLRSHYEKQWKTEMERERERIQPPEARNRFLAGAAFGPVSGLTGKFGTGAGLWFHSVRHGEGGGHMASLLSLESGLLRPVAAALLAVAATGSVLLWNGQHDKALPEETPAILAQSPVTIPALAAVADAETPAVVAAEALAAPEAVPAAAASQPVFDGASTEATAALASVSGRVLDEEQLPLAGAKITVVATGLQAAPPSGGGGFGFGGSGGFGGGGGSGFGGGGSSSSSGGGGGFGGGGGSGGFGGTVSAGGSGGGSSGQSTVFATPGGMPATDHVNLEQGALLNALLDPSLRYSTETAADGTFSIPDVPVDGVLVVSAEAPGYCLQGTSIAPGASTTELSLSLKPGISVRGQVLSTQGQAVSDAIVQTIGLAWKETGLWGGWGRSPQNGGWSRTDARGGFTMTVERAGLANLTVRSATQGDASFQELSVEEGGVLSLRYPALSGLEGRLTLPDGAAAAGHQLQLIGYAESELVDEEHGHLGSSSSAGVTVEVMTDEAGDYQAAGLDPRLRYAANILDPAGMAMATELEIAPLKEGLTVHWDCRIPRPIQITGSVVSAISGEAIADAMVLCTVAEEDAPFGPPVANATTGPDGRFALQITQGAGRYRFGVQTRDELRASVEREVKEGETVDLQLELPEGAESTVLDRSN